MKTDIYTLLGMIKDGKAPEKIMYESEEYVWNDIDKTYYCCDHDRTDLLNDYVITDILSNEVEILEATITYKQDDKFTGMKYYDDGIEIASMDYSTHYSMEELVEEDDKIEKLDQTLNRLDIDDDYYRYIMENRFKINEIIEALNER